MASKRDRITLQDALRGRFESPRKRSEEASTELGSDLKALFSSLEGRELVVAFIERIQRDAAERVNLSVDADFHTITVIFRVNFRAPLDETVKNPVIIWVYGPSSNSSLFDFTLNTLKVIAFVGAIS